MTTYPCGFFSFSMYKMTKFLAHFPFVCLSPSPYQGKPRKCRFPNHSKCPIERLLTQFLIYREYPGIRNSVVVTFLWYIKFDQPRKDSLLFKVTSDGRRRRGQVPWHPITQSSAPTSATATSIVASRFFEQSTTTMLLLLVMLNGRRWRSRCWYSQRWKIDCRCYTILHDTHKLLQHGRNRRRCCHGL